LKLDCQGHEYRALLGASQLLVNPGVQVIKFEFFPIGLRQVGDEPAALLRLLHAAGYDLFVPGRNGDGRVPPTEVAYANLERTTNRFSPSGKDMVARRRAHASPSNSSSYS